MDCPICGAELESEGSGIRALKAEASSVMNFYYCPNCDNDLQYDGEEAWDVILPVACYICIVQGPVLEGKPVRKLTLIEGGEQDENDSNSR